IKYKSFYIFSVTTIGDKEDILTFGIFGQIYLKPDNPPHYATAPNKEINIVKKNVDTYLKDGDWNALVQKADEQSFSGDKIGLNYLTDVPLSGHYNNISAGAYVEMDEAWQTRTFFGLLLLLFFGLLLLLPSLVPMWRWMKHGKREQNRIE
ncbi:MAG: hypothetical protein AABZ60_24540, partial [Planctomycetota bacterium]